MTKKHLMKLYKQILIDTKLKTGKRGPKKKSEWNKSIKEAKVQIGL
jgi:hypothetical protein